MNILLHIYKHKRFSSFAPSLKGVKKINLLPLGFGANKLIYNLQDSFFVKNANLYSNYSPLNSNTMKTSFLITFIMFSFSVCLAQHNNQEDVNSPDIFFEQTTVDFGSISNNSNPEIIYKFTNTGTAPLLLTAVKPSCGCTTPQWPKEPIAAGESAVIKATFNTRGNAGKYVTKSISVTTNIRENGKYKVIILLFKGQVEADK